jgi:hypothetical protein
MRLLQLRLQQHTYIKAGGLRRRWALRAGYNNNHCFCSSDQHDPQISADKDKYAQTLTHVLLNQLRYLYTETIDGELVARQSSYAIRQYYDSIGPIGPSGHYGYPNIRNDFASS